MTPEDERKVESLIEKVSKAERPGWVAVVEKIILPVVLALATIMLGINGCNKDKIEIRLLAEKQRQDSVNAKSQLQRDSVNTTREYQLSLVKLYSENISSGDSTKIKNAQNLIYLMDSSFAVKILSMPWYSFIQNSGDPVYPVSAEKAIHSQRDLLLRYSKVIVYYDNGSLKAKALLIDSLLRLNGTQSMVSLKSYDLSKENQIVYYNVSQLNYCKAVQDLLQKNGFGVFDIRPSSGKSTSTDFKIYVVK